MNTMNGGGCDFEKIVKVALQNYAKPSQHDYGYFILFQGFVHHHHFSPEWLTY